MVEEETDENGSHEKLIITKVMRDFIGLEQCDEGTSQAMLDFSYNLASGNLDEAFKSIKLIKADSVWESMARMCVKTKRLDVASVCLGNLGHARGARALREAEGETAAVRCAIVAIQMGMLEDAEKLLKQAKKFDILNEYYQAKGEWNLAVQLAEKEDRIHLRNTHYQFAKYHESLGDIDAAISEYELADTHRFEVPRMLLGQLQKLESFVTTRNDPKLLGWWAQYCESIGDLDAALKYYHVCKDYLSIVRVMIYSGQMENAIEVVDQTQDRAAAYHMARHFENGADVKRAISLYSKAQCHSHAFRLAKENDFDDMVCSLALLSSPENMLEAAEYYEKKSGMMDKAVMLYHKGGRVTKALDMCFRNNQYDALRSIADDLDENTDPQLLDKCSRFFTEHNQHDKAVNLLLIGKKYGEALQRCIDCNVKITDELAEKFTLDKTNDERENQFRLKLLEKLAECCQHQQSYHLACKKFTQAGDKLRAMRALVQSGDAEKIIFFAGVSKQREVYILAANYLQSLDWRRNPETMKHIISFYTKARALDSLAGFYDACAQVEIDEFQNYEKACGALREAFKCMSKAKTENPEERDQKLMLIQHKLQLVEKFAQIRQLAEIDAEEMLKQCQILLEEPNLEEAIRVGDVYGLMIEFHESQGNYAQAYTLLQKLASFNPNIDYYVEPSAIDTICSALNVPRIRPTSNQVQTENHAHEFPTEDIDEALHQEEMTPTQRSELIHNINRYR